MRGILQDKKRRGMNAKGQVIIINMLFLVMTIVVFVAMVPVLRDTINDARNYDALNCKSNPYNTDCSTANVPCYNSTLNSETVACAMVDLYIPYIVIVVLIAGVAKLMANRVEGFVSPQQQAPYPY